MKHTQGPWKMFIGKEHCLHDTTRIAIIAAIESKDGKFEETIAEVWPGDNDCDIADGKLIAAALELLEACKKAYKWMVYPTAISEEMSKKIRKQLGEAIRKVEDL